MMEMVTPAHNYWFLLSFASGQRGFQPYACWIWQIDIWPPKFYLCIKNSVKLPF